MTHLKWAGCDRATQEAALEEIVRGAGFLVAILETARALDLPDWWLVSGAIYNTVWNSLTGRPLRHGIKDADLFYFDPDLSWEAEDRQIRRAARHFAADPPVELRNQARVHLWYEAHFGQPYPPLTRTCDAIDNFACRTHAVGLRLEADDRLRLYAPFGLDDIFAFRLTPNPVRDNRATHEAKAVRQCQLWPELTVVPWPETPGQSTRSRLNR
ncbi:MAG: hypothetical protein CSA74_12015 [Rhodobacterales bacterium]|nr:MAG: hypothetical protein CSA74_12015 [Rhodobacterales bacterium]